MAGITAVYRWRERVAGRERAPAVGGEHTAGRGKEGREGKERGKWDREREREAEAETMTSSVRQTYT